MSAGLDIELDPRTMLRRSFFVLSRILIWTRINMVGITEWQNESGSVQVYKSAPINASILDLATYTSTA